MFQFLRKYSKGIFKKSVFEHNSIDSGVMSRFLGMQVSPNDFNLDEDRTKDLAPGVVWRRRRFRFMVAAPENAEQPERPEALCINEVWLDSQAAAELRPALAAEFPHLLELPEIENAYWATTFAKGALRAASASNEKETRLYLNMGRLCFQMDAAEQRKALQDLLALEQRNAQDEVLIKRLEKLDPQIAPQPAGGFGVVRFLPAFPASRLVQSAGNILAATNAGFFLNFPEEYDDRVSSLHQPVGGHMVAGRLLAPPWIARPGFVGLKDGRTIPGLYGPQDIVLHMEGLWDVPLRTGRFDGDNPQGQVWRFFDAEEIPAPPDAAALLFTGSVLISIEPARKDLRPPVGGALVLLTGEHARAALAPNGYKAISLALKPVDGIAVDWMVSAGPFLVRDSRAVTPEEMLEEKHAGEFRPLGPAPTRFPFDTSKTRAPRTAIGETSAGGLKIVVVDGRRSGEHSCGLTLEGLAQLMQWVGCETAINLDGGGSSVMAIEGATAEDRLRENSAYGVVNIPSDDGERERIVPIFLIIKGK
ncbi:hypothetical protein BH09SUM1_BH09SUM1_01250 [soil metagenome]